jgi:hypothetical protein
MSNEKDRPMPDAARGRAKVGGRTRGGGSGDGSVERAIGSRLRAYYDEVAREPVPDRFVELLKRLDTDGSSK